MKLRRITTHGNWIPEIDSLRFVAILATLLNHILGHIVDETALKSPSAFPISHDVYIGLMVRGGRGVPLFFAISGFILAQPFMRQHLLHGQPVSVKAYFKRRLTRLEPPYILSLLIYTAALSIRQYHPRALMRPLLAHMVYVHNFSHLKQINFVTWSLEVEVQFYILAPLLGYLYAISSKTVRRSIIVALMLSSTALQAFSHGVAAVNLPGQLQFFLAGFLLADLRANRSESTIHKRWDLVSLLVWPAIFCLPAAWSAYTLSLLILLAYLAVFNGPRTRQIFRAHWIAITGGMCYSFYLMHVLIISIFFRYTRRFLIPSSVSISFLLQALLLGVFIYVFCTAYFIFIERPCMDPNWPRKLYERLSKRAVSTP